MTVESNWDLNLKLVSKAQDPFYVSYFFPWVLSPTKWELDYWGLRVLASIGSLEECVYRFSALHVRTPRQRDGIGTPNRYEENCVLNDVLDS